MWRYIAATLLFLIGALEIILSLNGRLRDEIMKNSPVPFSSAAPYYLFFAGLSAFVVALGILIYSRFL
ncbi:MAG TPA: hypothetical protein VK208_12820 [Pyrinomonadaceae bacterium]|nr:hypothetical protein [Pyrinomonadaceae bacterium]